MKTREYFNIRGILAAVVVCIAASTLYAEDPPTVAWHKVFDSGNDEIGYGIAVDGAGNVYVAGFKDNATNTDFLVIKYNSSGDTVWTRTYNSGDSASAINVAADHAGNVYATGTTKSGTWDYVTIKYDRDGNEEWASPAIYNSLSQDGAWGVAPDASGNVYVGGMAHGKFVTIKYNSDGTEMWNKMYGTASDAGSHGIAVDEAGYIYSSGWFSNLTNSDFVTIKYTPSGDTVWTRVFDSGKDDASYDVAARGGYVYAAGPSIGSADYDSRLMKYDSDGNLVWNKTYDSGNNDVASGVAVDADGFVYLSCVSNMNYLVMKYSPSGDTLWTKVNDSGENEGAWAVAVDDSGYVYITGCTWNGANSDIHTIKYKQAGPVGVAEKLNESPLSLEVLGVHGSNVTLSCTFFSSPGTLSFYSADGRLIESFTLSSNQSSINWDAPSFPSGVYFARLESEDKSISRKILVVK